MNTVQQEFFISALDLTLDASDMEITASANIDSKPLSLSIALTRRLGGSNMDPILISRICLGAEGTSWPIRVGAYSVSAGFVRHTLIDSVLFREWSEVRREIDRHLYNAANHFSTSGIGGRSVASTVFEATLMTNTILPSSFTLSTRHPRRSLIMR